MRRLIRARCGVPERHKHRHNLRQSERTECRRSAPATTHYPEPLASAGGFFIGAYMPPRTPKACRVRGCRNTTTDPSGYCENHKGEGWKSYKPGQSRQQRGYGTKWEVIRARILKRDKGLCQNHLRQGVAKQASCVDHIKAKAHGGTDDDINLESLCWSCHAAKTASERLK